ncbi:MAG: hypothetical protein ACFFD9_05360, partial [Candidatus Thorarchaeota archaeon]
SILDQGEFALYGPLPILIIIGILLVTLIEPHEIDSLSVLTTDPPLLPVQDEPRETQKDTGS